MDEICDLNPQKTCTKFYKTSMYFISIQEKIWFTQQPYCLEMLTSYLREAKSLLF